MTMEDPSDLIHQLQISLRKEAGVTNYNPEDLTPSDIPSLQEAIQGLEPSPPYLRCKQCRGRLLRGLQSIVCVYCGAPQQREIPPDPISFKSSFGYSWLLQSLDLDGSEAVEASDSNKGQIMPSVLSDLLNIELKWPTEFERTIDEATDKAPNVVKNPLNLAGVDLDSFFSETEKVTAPLVSEIPAKAVEVNVTHTSPDLGSSSLLKSAQPIETFANPSQWEVDDSSSGWEAEFQSAEVRSLPAESKSLDLFPDASPISVSKTSDVTFVPERKANFGFDDIDDNKEENHSVPQVSSSHSWISDNQWHTVIKDSSANGSEVAKNGKDVDNSNNLSPVKDDLFQDDLWLSGTEKHGEDKESLDPWQDFTSSANALDPFSSSQNLSGTTNGISLGKEVVSLGTDLEGMEFGNFMTPDLFPGTTSIHNGSAGNNVQAVSSSDRVVDTNTGNLNSAQNGGGTTPSELSDETVERLMSQMHDLSFMLDTNLSIPLKDQA